MDSNKEKIMKRINTLYVLAMLSNVIAIIACCIGFFEWKQMIKPLYEVVIACYMLVQMQEGISKLLNHPSEPSILTVYVRRVAYACFASGIGSSIIATIIMILDRRELHLVCNATILIVGVLLLVGEKVYRYGCENKLDTWS